MTLLTRYTVLLLHDLVSYGDHNKIFGYSIIFNVLKLNVSLLHYKLMISY